MRFFIKFSYNGTNYHGWQRQSNSISVQGTLEKALSLILNQNTKITGASRTDTGVHAKEMYAHFDVEIKFNIDNLVYKLNCYLPKDIVVFEIFEVYDQAHARFDAKKRTYKYYINSFKDAFTTNQSWYYPQSLDIELMNLAAKNLLFYADFQCFCKLDSNVSSFDCKILEAFFIHENNVLIFKITSNRFLRNMVRSIIGTLIYVGLKKISTADFEQVIISKLRSKSGFSVPACGLFLTEIDYDFHEIKK